MDAGLAEIMINNIVKNAVKHNIDNGYIDIQLKKSWLTIINSGKPYPGDASSLLLRFTKGDEGNIGIGLAIVREICDLYQFKLSYTIEDTTHILTILFDPK